LRTGTLMVLLKLSPKDFNINHPFWRKISKLRLQTEEKAIKSNKLKEYEDKFAYFAVNWRLHKEIIMDFYSYLKLNFPNAIPFSLFFSYKDKSLDEDENAFDVDVDDDYTDDDDNDEYIIDEDVPDDDDEDNYDVYAFYDNKNKPAYNK
jgi:hypothetical protein